ncbi:MAG: flagellar biosynthesis protein FlhF [Planctomycetota bacterium]
MEVKTFRARSIQEALEYVRQELGQEAAVLSTREVRSGVWDWFTGDSQIEVTAATDVAVVQRVIPTLAAPAAPTVPSPSTAAITATSGSGTSAAGVETWSARLRRESRSELRNSDAAPSLIEQLCRHQQESPSARRGLSPTLPLLSALLAAELPEELAREFVERAQVGLSETDRDDELLLQARLLRILEDEMRVTGPIRVLAGQHRRIALVGPTGVGKTTTIAKLATRFRLEEQLTVGLLTMDSPRSAGVDQLRTFAEKLGVSWEAATNAHELHSALARLSHCDVILLDTAGRSPTDHLRLQELKHLLSEAATDEVHLVLSSTTSSMQMRKAVEQFGRLGLDSLIISKMDEAASLGSLVTVPRATRLPLSYLTMGQDIAHDLEVVDRRTMARRLIVGMEGSW